MHDAPGDNCTSYCGITIHDTAAKGNEQYESESNEYEASHSSEKESDADNENEDSDTMMEEEMMDDSQPCPSSKWLWITHSTSEGEAHFLIGDDVATAVCVVGYRIFIYNM